MTKLPLIPTALSTVFLFGLACSPTPRPTAPTPTTTPTPARREKVQKLSAEARGILKVHNAARRAVGVAPLTWSPRIARYAQAWANRLANMQTLRHRPHTGPWKQQYGENLAMAGGSNAVATYGETGSRQWLSEKRRYNHRSRSLAGVGHYTQMV